MQRKIKVAPFTLILLLVLSMLYGCEYSKTANNTPQAYNVTPSVVTQTLAPNTPQATETLRATETPQATETQEPTATPFVNTSAKLGIVGDIMIMQSQVRNAFIDGKYDFTRSFEPMRVQFCSVDFMCGNLETPLAGESAGYSEAAPTLPPATTENPHPTKAFQTFNAPDELAYNLKELGFDMLTTANNHCLDRGYDGLLDTLSVLDDAELKHTGTFYDKEDRNTPCIVEINGIRIGFIAYSAGFNRANRGLSTTQLQSISYLYDYDYVKAQIELTRGAGAEFIVVFPHCGEELSHTPTEEHKTLFRKMIEWGADAIIASHPHVVQPIEWAEVERADGSVVRAPIVYSLGNFISNMAPSPKDYGLFVTLTVEKTENGVVAGDLSYLPTYCIRQYTHSATIHQTLPCYADTDSVTSYIELSRAEKAAIKKARDFVVDICGSKYIYPDTEFVS